MLKVAEGFIIIWLIIGVGYLVAKLNLLGPGAQPLLGRLAYWVFGPALMLEILSRADLSQVFSAPFLVAGVSASACFTALLIWWRLRGKPLDASVVGALTGSYSNVGNLGLPFATFVLGSPSHLVAPMIFQLAVMQPITIGVLDIVSRGRTASPLKAIGYTFLNPMLWGTGIGILLGTTHTQLPQLLAQPIHILAQGQVPALLLGFGISLVGTKILQSGVSIPNVLIASASKLLLMPLIAWGVATLLGLSGPALFAVVSLAALPTAQNVFVTATRYEIGMKQSRETILLTTIASAPIMIILAGLLS